MFSIRQDNSDLESNLSRKETIQKHLPVLEICTDNIESALIAEENGADRIELCEGLELGGLTASVGLIKKAKELLKIPVYVLIRPRAGDFVYSENEILIMKEDIATAVSLKADGIVFGALKDGRVDKESCKTLLDVAENLPATFHRAFDYTLDMFEALEDIITLGFNKILTSGQEPTAFKGQYKIKRLINKANSRITIMPGSGISSHNIHHLIQYTKAVEYHSSGQHRKETTTSVSSEISVVQGATFYPKVSATEVKTMKKKLMM